MGHVDHGKTKLLDTICSSERGSHRSGWYHPAYRRVPGGSAGQKITFLDTPGHEAFTAMRARGAQVTDIVMLVVAADDGVMPQTFEAFRMRKPRTCRSWSPSTRWTTREANPERVMTQLSEQGLMPTQWGGDTEFIKVSARANTGIQDLLETILLVAELGNLQPSPQRPATGTIVEAEMDRNRGPIATVLIENGTLNLRDYVVAGSTWGRVKAMKTTRAASCARPSPPPLRRSWAWRPCPGRRYPGSSARREHGQTDRRPARRVSAASKKRRRVSSR